LTILFLKRRLAHDRGLSGVNASTNRDRSSDAIFAELRPKFLPIVRSRKSPADQLLYPFQSCFTIVYIIVYQPAGIVGFQPRLPEEERKCVRLGRCAHAAGRDEPSGEAGRN